jgi:hypothetical protein
MARRSLSRRTLLRAGLAGAVLGSAGRGLAVDEVPTAEISNGLIRAKLYLPDTERGYYRGTRFDWAGVIGSLEYAGHHYYGPWFDRIEPSVRDFTYAGSEIVVGRASGVTGPAEEFVTGDTALGFEEASPGGTFVKIGVGVLRKPQDGRYDRFGTMEIVGPGKRQVKARDNEVEFLHELSDPASGYAYHYQKQVRLVKGEPRMRMEHALKNTGRKPIRGEVYNHNFLVLDRLPPGPGLVITLPFPVQADRPPPPELAEVRGNQVLYRKVLEGRDTVYTGIRGFGDSPKEYDIRVEHARAGAGYRVTGDRPLSRLALWSIRTNVSVEPFVRMDLPPGGEFTWTYTYDYYDLRGG